METNQNPETGLAVNPVTVLTTVISTNASKLAELLMENIQKVQADPKYIPQADAVNSQVKSLIDLGKAEIEMLKVTAFINHKG